MKQDVCVEAMERVCRVLECYARDVSRDRDEVSKAIKQRMSLKDDRFEFEVCNVILSIIPKLCENLRDGIKEEV